MKREKCSGARGVTIHREAIPQPKKEGLGQTKSQLLGIEIANIICTGGGKYHAKVQEKIEVVVLIFAGTSREVEKRAEAEQNRIGWSQAKQIAQEKEEMG